MSIDKTDVEKLYKAILKLKTVDDCKEFFNDLCTENEILQMTQRIVSAECLLNGETYEEVIAKTEISSKTLSRVSKCVKNGSGYKKVLK